MRDYIKTQERKEQDLKQIVDRLNVQIASRPEPKQIVIKSTIEDQTIADYLQQ